MRTSLTPVVKPYHGTPLHSLRIPDDVWQAARSRAAEERTNVNAEVVEFLRAYGEGQTFVRPGREDA